MAFIEATFSALQESESDILVALLSQWEHNGIMEGQGVLKVYFQQDVFPKSDLEALAQRFSCNMSMHIVKEQNWNQKWEESFQPVIIEEFCGIRADFHPPLSNIPYELIITPRMSFGTGHHATTALMVQLISQLELHEKRVLDFGCGTGILAILAEKMGAVSILGLDNDDGAVNNALENAERNGCMQIEVKNESLDKVSSRFDCIFANINRNVLLAYMDSFPSLLTDEGLLLLSGFYTGKDEEVIKTTAGTIGLKLLREQSRDKWSALMFQK